MAEIVGYNGDFNWTGIVDRATAGYHTHTWSLDLVADALDATDFDSTGWRDFIAGLKGWTGSVELNVDSSARIAPSDVGASAAIKFFLNSSNTLTGTAICTGWHPAVAVDGLETQTLDIQGTGILTPSDA